MKKPTPPTNYIKDELSWLYNLLCSSPDIFLLEELIDAAKDYSASTVHKWGMGEHGALYEKIRDLVKVRIFGAVKSGKLDRVLAGEILKTYYYAIDKNREGGAVEVVLSEGDKAMLKRAGIYYAG